MALPLAVAGRSLPRTLAFVIGSAVTALGVTMLVAACVSLFYEEWATASRIGLAALVTVTAGLALWRVMGRAASIGVKEGFATVGLAWFVVSIFGALPYLFTGAIPDITDAYFETVSGFTTTGSTIVANPADLPHGVGIWRAITQWVGGMGVIVLSVAILPLLGTGGVQLARAEFPGGSPDRLTPRFQETAKRLWLVYAALTAILAALLMLGDLDGYQAVVHALTTMATGGFGTEASSIASFSAYTQWVITAFMLLAGINFALHYRALREPRAYLRSAELKLYIALTLVATIIVTGGLLRDMDWTQALRDAAFSVVSVITTTGFATADWAAWRPALQIVVIGMMFLGGMSGSTSGSVKIFRVGILSKAAFSDLRRLVHPRAIFTIRFGRNKVSDNVVESVQSFFLFYMVIYLVGTFLLTFIDANLSERLDLVTATSAVAAALGNIGPALGDVGPTSTFATIPDVGKWLLAGLMIVGRLEIFPVLLLFTRDLWRR
ncbi:MAG TPA: TrkH family potassium uptake protein [Acidimicrobiia bacterium]|nr:TrkH family potassium uptake protein [Acidimicrobiia bacterium]